METVFTLENGSFNPNGLIDFILTFLVLGAFNVFVIYFVKRRFPLYTTVGFSGAMLLACILKLNFLEAALSICLIVTSVLYLIANMAETRSIIANRFISPKKIRNAVTKENIIEKSYDKDALYKTINEAVLYLSKHKIGAIITFERKDNLDNLLKNGSILNAPVTYELLITIFYPGTRLHDGAVVIRDDTVIAASVYYTPTTKPLIGKYGSRHRAAIGISEICDAVTVVVSEETGRISIAYNGELESYNPDNFYKAFGNIMSETETNDETEERSE